eukprot:14873427-Alexandrium_andersonii.AAC.1
MRPYDPEAARAVQELTAQLNSLASEILDYRRRTQWPGLAGTWQPPVRGAGRPGWTVRRAGEIELDLREGVGYPCSWTVTAVFRLAERYVRCPDYDLLYPINALRNVALL